MDWLELDLTNLGDTRTHLTNTVCAHFHLRPEQRQALSKSRTACEKETVRAAAQTSAHLELSGCPASVMVARWAGKLLAYMLAARSLSTDQERCDARLAVGVRAGKTSHGVVLMTSNDEEKKVQCVHTTEIPRGDAVNLLAVNVLRFENKTLLKVGTRLSFLKRDADADADV